MTNRLSKRYQLQNLLHTMLLLTGMLLLLGLIGWVVAGFIGVVWALGCGVLILLMATGISSRLVLLLYDAQPVAHYQLKPLSDIIEWLTVQSHLALPPRLYYIPSRALLAFSVGMQNDPAIAISDGMLRTLNSREMVGVLAHEIRHIKNKDLWVMIVADVISRITGIMALSGYLIVLVYLPLTFLQDQQVPWLLLALLILAPNLSALMQLALSRTREFNADLQATKLTGDPQGLMSALNKIEHQQTHGFKQLLFPTQRLPHPSLLRTHPLTEERIERLQSLLQQEQHPFFREQKIQPGHLNISTRAPRNRFTGLWH